ncbi:uncharacterized protein PHACADRAFT_247655 [Phanerochaete carnosa HHB-10118-sp]|uniref:Uncharacterized protein n=1 Tax=Phanerochaete carnosa (strain HHB-10118-sp) TaxID=650164 RepID=K5WP16_PHACS|nr:uncharacterized protein PHACADRAFT_247655 [Phanerochaete carnosa HHB-10118-sp]EKM61200.1 hypothetical protein PHACADRAFT_247655 [Phanerochaete carnosa HHB-10118-sp]
MPPGFVETTPAEGVNQAPTVSESRQAYPGSSAFQAEHPRGQPRALATLPLTHHITLLRYPSLIERTGQQNTDAISRKDDGLNRFKGLIRTPGNPTTAEFVFAVHDFGVTLEPDGIFRR